MTTELRFLGSPQVTVEERSIDTKLRRKEIALLAYLAAQKQPTPRETAVALLWGDMDDDHAKHNLSVTQSRINKFIPGAIEGWRNQPIVLSLLVQQQTDVWQFEERIRRSDLEGACALYRGPLLDGLGLKDANAFEDWLSESRQHYERLALDCLTSLMDDAEKRADSAALERHARRMLAINPFREVAYRCLMLVLGRKGDFNAALQTYSQCAGMLRREFDPDVAPSAETMALHERILLARAAPRRVLPFHAATFVGRDKELAEAMTQLLDPACRLLTLLGLGGVGKTRLAIELARRARQSFLHDVAYISLESPGARITEETLLTAMAQVLELNLSAGKLLQQIVDFLRPREMLLVLDNFESFVSVSRDLTTILREALDVKILSTSRQRLDVPDETVYQVHGMTYPDSAVGLHPTVSAPVSSSHYDAIALFDRNARQLDAAFTPAAEIEAITQICRLVEGLPLAIELIAPWILSMSCSAIAAKLSTEIQLLIDTERNFPERHRSLHVVFKASWNFLTPLEQRIFKRLSVILGEISPAAAEAIAEAPKAILDCLARKSMIEAPEEGRYRLHSLLRAFGEEKLRDSGELDDAQAEHYAYFSRYVAARLPDLRGAGQLEAFRQLEEEFTNIQAAWRYGVEHAPDATLSSLMDGIAQLCAIRNWHVLGVELFQLAAESLVRRGMTGLHARLAINEGLLHYQLGNYDLAHACAVEGRAYFEAFGDERGLAQALHLLGSIQYDLNQYERAEWILIQSLNLYHRLEDDEGIADCYVLLGHIVSLRTFFFEGGKIQRYKPPHRFMNEHYTPSEEKRAGAEEAIARFTEALELYREAGHLQGMGLSLHGLGFAHYVLHNYDTAIACFQEAAERFRELNAASDLTQSLLWLATVLQIQGKLVEARPHFHEALRVGAAAHAYKQLLDCLQKYSLLLWIADKDHFMPLAINAFVAEHPNTDGRMRVVAQEWVENISDFMRRDEGDEAVQKAIAYGRQQSLLTLVHSLLPNE
jgi:predicted ATPase/DNA-binding SARP family transcriptional activator